MEQRGEEIHASETEASGGSKEGVVRWVLIIGTLLAVIALTLIWVTGAAVQDDGADSETSVENQAAAPAPDTSDVPVLDEPSAAAAPEASVTPGDAPAGDPQSDAQ